MHLRTKIIFNKTEITLLPKVTSTNKYFVNFMFMHDIITLELLIYIS